MGNGARLEWSRGAKEEGISRTGEETQRKLINTELMEKSPILPKPARGTRELKEGKRRRRKKREKGTADFSRVGLEKGGQKNSSRKHKWLLRNFFKSEEEGPRERRG